jgi:hypothetical protein
MMMIMRNDDSNHNNDGDIIIITYNLLVSVEPYLYYHYQEVVGQLSIYQSLDSSHASMIYIYYIMYHICTVL